MDDATTTPADRRLNRTDSTLEALSRLVEASRRRSGVGAVAVADRAGLLLAGAGAHQVCEELAAYAPLVVRSADNDTVPSCLDSFEGRMRLRRVSIDGIQIVVSFSGSGADTASELDAVAAGCARILRQG